MNHLLGGSFFPHDRISVIAEQGNGLDWKEVRRPKIIVGISLTPSLIKTFDPSFWVFPAVLDIGCNTAFEIDENHLYYWNSTRKRHFDFVRRHTPTQSGERGYEYRMGNIWLHLEPYTGPKFFGKKMPFLLMGSDEITVMDAATPAQPRFPLLGLKALQENNLILSIDASKDLFDIYEA